MTTSVMTLQIWAWYVIYREAKWNMFYLEGSQIIEISHMIRVSLKSMMTTSNGNIFRITGPLCGEFTGDRCIPSQRPVTWTFDVFLDLHLNKWLNKQPWNLWFEMLSRPLWRHCNAFSSSWSSDSIKLYDVTHQHWTTLVQLMACAY